MIKVLFICHGNICRSPMAEFVFKNMVSDYGIADMFHIESAATSTEEILNGVGNSVYPPAKAKLAENGISCEGKRARQTVRSDYNKFDYIIGMDHNNLRNMKRIYGSDPENKLSLMLDYTCCKGDVADPWYTGNFDATWKDVNAGCEGFIKYLRDNKEI